MGAISVILVDSSTWLFRNGWIVWLGFFAIALVITYKALALVARQSSFLHAVAGAVFLAVLSGFFVVGLFLPYALGVGDRTTYDFAEDSETPWENLLLFMLAGAAVVGAFLGGLTGFLRGSIESRS